MYVCTFFFLKYNVGFEDLVRFYDEVASAPCKFVRAVVRRLRGAPNALAVAFSGSLNGGEENCEVDYLVRLSADMTTSLTDWLVVVLFLSTPFAGVTRWRDDMSSSTWLASDPPPQKACCCRCCFFLRLPLARSAWQFCFVL